MGNFGKGRSGGSFGGGRDRNRGGFGGGRDRGGRGGFGGGRDFGEREMHKATCGECGSPCEVPFRPTGERPVLCSDCFQSEKDSFGGRDFGGNNFSKRGRDNRDFSSDFGNDRPMYRATCADCGSVCEVPFRPTSDRPVFCDDCFVTDNNRSKVRKTDEYKQEFENLNAKLDKILKALEAAGLKKEPVLIKLNKEVKIEELSLDPIDAIDNSDIFAAEDVVEKPKKARATKAAK